MIAKPCCRLLLLVGLLLVGKQAGWGAVCATSAVRPAQKGLATQGIFNALVIFSRFQDEDDGKTAVPDFARRIFDPQWPGSLTHFYREMSRGQFQLQGEYLPRWYTSRRPASTYLAADPAKLGGFTEFVEEILAAVDEDTDLGRYDNDGPDGLANSGDDDGYVDFVFINTRSAPEGFILGRATGIAILSLHPEYVSDDPAAIGGFIRVRADNDRNGVGGVVLQGRTFEMAVGTMAHEIGHVLGLPDLHDKNFADPEEDSAGIGYWGLMAHGARGWNDRGGPNPFCAWSLEQLGWIGIENEDLVVVEGNLKDAVFADMNAGGKVFKLPTQVPYMYYLAVHRRPGASYYERHLPAAGLLIWQINTLKRTNTVEENKKVDLVCADGLYADAGYPLGRQAAPESGRDNLDFWAHDADYRLEHRGNMGDATDVFDGIKYTEFSLLSNPTALPRVSITNIRRRGTRMLGDIHLDDDRWAGSVWGDEVWEDTIEVVGDIVIPPGNKLSIASGTVVRFAEDLSRTGQDEQRAELVVQGELSVGGTPTRPVLFTSGTAVPQPGDWYGIVVQAAGKVEMHHAAIEYAYNGLSGGGLRRTMLLEDVAIHQALDHGIRFEDIRAHVVLSRLEVRAAGTIGVQIGGEGLVEIRSSRFVGNGRIGLERLGGELKCTGSEFEGNGLQRDEGGHLHLVGAVSGRVAGNSLYGGVGIRCFETLGVRIEGNRLVDSRTGLISSSAQPWIGRNEFTRNQLALLVSGVRVPNRVELNVVQESARLLDNRAATEVVARHNWWGQTNAEGIAERMSGAVEWRPFLNFDPRQPLSFALAQNYPNPFNGRTVIDYSIDIDAFADGSAGDMVLEVYAVTGGVVRRLVEQPAVPGRFSVVWDGRDGRGESVASGVYYYQLKVGSDTEVKRLLLLK